MTAPVATTAPPPSAASGSLLSKIEIDVRMLGMLAALAVIWIGFDILSGGVFLTPRNLWNLSVQTASVAIMATGMVLVIVTRNIDLSVGAILGVVGMIIGVAQVQWLPAYLGLEHWLTAPLAVLIAIAVGGLIGLFQGWLIAYLGIPSFIVTLGGLLVWRGAAWWVTTGQTVAPMDTRFKAFGGGVEGALGATATWIIAAIACGFIVMALGFARRRRLRFGFPVRPGWADGGLFIPHGVALPVLIAVVVGLIMTFIATRRRFGRYVFAIGGNPEAAELSGINTRWTLMKVFGLMGLLCGISACISTARLNAATNAAGTLDELYVIASAVIGGTSLAGGIGTIAGAMLGALVMQSLQSGMVLLGVDTPLQNIVVGAVLVLAVWADGLYRRRIK